MQQLWWLQTAIPLPGGCDRECKTIPGAAPSPSLCLIPGCPLSPHCWHQAGGGGCSPCPLSLLVPCHLPLGLEPFVPLPRDPRHRGAAGLLEALQEGSAVSFGSPRSNLDFWGMSWGPPPLHKHFPLRRLFFPTSVALERVADDTEPPSPPRRRRQLWSTAEHCILSHLLMGRVGSWGTLEMCAWLPARCPIGLGAPDLPASLSLGCLWFQW